MSMSKKCVCVRAYASSSKSLTNPGIWFSHSMKPKQSGPWQRAAVKIQLLKRGENRPTEQRKRLSIPPASGSKGHLFNLKTITLLPSFPNHRLKHIPRGLSCSVTVCCFDLVHTLTSPPAQAWPLPFYPHSRDCERHTNRDSKNIIIKVYTNVILCRPASVNVTQ